jgi:NAD(P)-dependent dehydrogenase (short-subunit alcohol dehydrogenase family)
MAKTIFITGSSSGLGKATAEYFASKGWQVAATMRTPTTFSLPNVKVFKLDVTDTTSVKQAVSDAIAAFGKIDVVVNNAGVGVYGALELATEEDINKTWNTNVKGVMNVITAFLPHFRANKAGMFINVGSAMGLTTTMPLLSLYHMSKYALEGLSEGLYYELKPLGIDIHMIEPGGFSSELNRNVVLNRNADITGYEAFTDKVENLLQHYDDLPLGTVEEIVDVIDALANKTSTKFRTVIGEAANQLIARKNAMSVEDFLETSLNYFK